MVGSRMLHPPELYTQIKVKESAPYFRQNKVATCRNILMNYDGKSVAIAYPLDKTGWKHPMSH